MEPLSYVVVSFPSGKGSPEKASDLKLVARNISRTGLGIVMPGFLPEGTILEITLPVDGPQGSSTPVRASIVWCVFMRGTEFQAGLQFQEPSFKARDAIEALMKGSA